MKYNMKYLIDENILQATLNYLASKPYNEVVGLLNELQKCEKLESTIKKD